MKKRIALGLFLALLLSAAAVAEATALDAFHALMEPEDGAGAGDGEALLDAVMAGEYGRDADEAALAAADALAEITGGEAAAYAAARGLAVGQVRNAWYRALARALAAEEASGSRDDNAWAVLELFLRRDAGDEAERGEIRGQMTPDGSRLIAGATGLPQAFVEFVIMNGDWDDDDWENDEDWQLEYGWAGGEEDISVGSRDSGDSTRIADLQSLLISLGYLKGKADGVFGPRTQAALLEFQLANGLPGTGVYDSRSLLWAQSDGAVARWDYEGEFWDSKDFDSPGSAASPDTPAKKKKDTPDAPKKKDTPDSPDTPAKKKKDSPDSPDSPD